MKRTRFIAALTAFTATPLALLSRTMFHFARIGKGFKVENGKDRFDASITLMEGDIFFTKISTTDTNGDLFLFESTRIAKGGPPLHYHPDQDEWFYILEGEFSFKIGNDNFSAKPGDSLFGPRTIPHAFAKTNEGPARMMIMYQPAGKMEQYFKSVSEGTYKTYSDAEMQTVRAAHGFVVIGPALEHEKK